MTVLRWLLSHMLLLIFVALGVTAWLNRDQLEIDAILNDLGAPVAVHEQARAEDIARRQTGSPDGQEAAASQTAEAGSDGGAVAVVTPTLDAAPEQAQPMTAVTPPGAWPSASDAVQPTVDEVEAQESDLASDWYAARRAFWDADLAEAERRYQQLIVENPDKPDAYGELGNLYYSQGAWVEAAKMYHQAGLLLIEQGESHRAASLVGILTALNPNLADELQNELGTAP